MRTVITASISIGSILVLIGGAILIFTFYPIIIQELSYDFDQMKNGAASHQNLDTTPQQIQPVSTDFGIVIPKIKANSKVIPNVNPYDPSIYQVALTKGVAQAEGSSLPYEHGNVFLFSHSSSNFYDAARYNSVFYLLYKLEKGDSIYLYYAGKQYAYQVDKKTIVDPTAIQYLSKTDGQDTLTLMTCWPPGTSFQRLLVTANLVEN